MAIRRVYNSTVSSKTQIPADEYQAMFEAALGSSMRCGLVPILSPGAALYVWDQCVLASWPRMLPCMSAVLLVALRDHLVKTTTWPELCAAIRKRGSRLGAAHLQRIMEESGFDNQVRRELRVREPVGVTWDSAATGASEALQSTLSQLGRDFQASGGPGTGGDAAAEAEGAAEVDANGSPLKPRPPTKDRPSGVSRPSAAAAVQRSPRTAVPNLAIEKEEEAETILKQAKESPRKDTADPSLETKEPGYMSPRKPESEAEKAAQVAEDKARAEKLNAEKKAKEDAANADKRAAEEAAAKKKADEEAAAKKVVDDERKAKEAQEKARADASKRQEAEAAAAVEAKTATLNAAIEKAIQTTYKKPWKAADIQGFNAKEKKAYERKFKTLNRTIDKEKLTTKGFSQSEVTAAKARYGIR
mmetsp:Transcript_6643/g.13587  ORF Transcript_6643/g.13587 Transcript_6643/m.13587 type:complete len:417 (-) Transcript_6643:164-1414(-)